MTEVVVFAVAALAIGAAGVVVGMLVAPRLTRLGADDVGDEPDHEDGP